MKAKPLLLCGAIAGPIFVGAFLIEGATRAGYDPMRHPVSSLALGPTGWTQTANFLLCGVLTIAFALGLRLVLKPGKASLWGPILVGLWGIGLVGAGLFVTDPVSGYPPGTPAITDPRTTHGIVHDLFGVLAFFSIPIACMVLTRRFAAERRRGWAIYSFVTGVVFLALFIGASMGFGQTPGWVDYAGLLQRLTVSAGWAWLTLLAIDLLRRIR